MKTKRISLFPSIISLTECDSFHLISEELIDWIYEYQKSDPGSQVSNKGGWQSSKKFYLNEKSFKKFYDYILFHINKSLLYYDVAFNVTNLWINLNKNGSYNMVHDHPLSDLAGVLWVKVPNGSGKFIMNSPNDFVQYNILDFLNRDVKQKENCDFSFVPELKEGNMIIFPSNLKHYVDVNQTDQDRISISFNLNAEV